MDWKKKHNKDYDKSMMKLISSLWVKCQARKEHEKFNRMKVTLQIFFILLSFRVGI